MNKKIISVLSILMSLSPLAGCTLGNVSVADKDDGQNQANVTGTTSTNNSNNGSNSGDINVTNPDNGSGDNGNTVTADPVIEVSNNGGNFVGVDGKIYFRQYGNYSICSVSSKEHFLDSSTYSFENQICCFDPDDLSDISVVCEDDDGVGELYYYDGYIYSSRHDWGDNPNLVYRVNISTGETEDIGYGQITCASADGRFLLTTDYDYDTDTIIYYIYDAGNQINVFTDDYGDYSSRIIGIDDENLYYTYCYYDDCQVEIYQTNFQNGNSVLLASIDAPESISEYMYITYVEPLDFKLETENLVFTLCYCLDIDEYVEDSYTVAVPVCTDMSASYIDEAMYEAKLVYNSEYINTCLFFPDFAGKVADLKVDDYGDNGFARGIQTVEEVFGKLYVIVADCYNAPSWNQGQFGSYELLSVHYYQMDNYKADPVEFNEDNPTFGDLMVKGWLVGTTGEVPEKLFFCYSFIDGPEGPFEDDDKYYVAEFADDFVYDHIPEGGDIYDDFVKDGMDYFVDELNEYSYHKYLSKLPEKDDFTNYKTPKEQNGDMYFYTSYYHIHLNSEGEIDYLRYVIFD